MARQHAKKLSAGTHVIRRSLKDGACRSLEASSALRGIARKDANARQGLGVSVRPAKKLRAGTRLIRRSLRDGAYHAPQPRAYSSLGGCGELIERGSGGGEKLAQKLFAGKRTIRRSLKDGACAYRSVEACGKRRFKELGDAGAGRGSEAHGTPVMARRHARKLSAGTRMIRRNLRERAYRSLKARGELGGSGRGQWSEAHERPEKRLRAGTRMMRRNLREGAYRSLEACSVPRKLGDAGEGQGSEAHERPAKRLRAGTRMMRRNLRKGVYSSFEAGDMLTSNSALCEDVGDVRTRHFAARALFTSCNCTSQSRELAPTTTHRSTLDLRRVLNELWTVKATSLELHTHKLIPRQVRRFASQRQWHSAIPAFLDCIDIPHTTNNPLQQTQRTIGGRSGSFPHLLLAGSCIPNGGLGVFAATSMAKGTWLTEYGGEIISVEEARQRRDCG